MRACVHVFVQTALSALEELRERQHLAAEEGREKARMLEERERVCL